MPPRRCRTALHQAATIVAALLVLVAAAAARAEGRVAILIGNASYANPELALRNPANDVRDLAPVLEDLGFATATLVDADRAATLAALDAFAERAAGASIALVFFAGHGVQVEGTNHLLTAGFRDLAPAELTREAVSLDEILARLDRAQPGVAFVILDACRNNPFSQDGSAALGLARSRGRTGTLIAYATDPGNVAFDGTGDNGTFTAALIDHLAAPGVEARLTFGRVRQQVALATGGSQVPYVEEAVLGEHFFNPDATAVPAEQVLARDMELWREATAEGTREAYRRYLTALPDGLFRPFAEERLAAAAARGDAPGGSASAEAFADADRGEMVTALASLGYLSPVRGRTPAAPEVETALETYLRQMTEAGAASPDRLYSDAAQATVVLGASTAQRIRTDMAALASIGTTLDMAGRARAELAALAATEPEAVPVLEAADRDLAAIHAARAAVLARLDESRTFYGELVERGRSGIGRYLPRALAGLTEKARSVPSLEGPLANAQLFIRHATAAGTRNPEGSYAWLADFVPQD